MPIVIQNGGAPLLRAHHHPVAAVAARGIIIMLLPLLKMSRARLDDSRKNVPSNVAEEFVLENLVWSPMPDSRIGSRAIVACVPWAIEALSAKLVCFFPFSTHSVPFLSSAVQVRDCPSSHPIPSCQLSNYFSFFKREQLNWATTPIFHGSMTKAVLFSNSTIINCNLDVPVEEILSGSWNSEFYWLSVPES